MAETDNWRSQAAYDYIDTLTPGDLAWEFLRRNPEYRQSYDELLATGQLKSEKAPEFAQQWGLRFRRRPASHSPCPADLLDPAGRPGGDPARSRSRAIRRLSSHH